MRVVKHQPPRNTIDPGDAEQVRALTKRLGVSAAELGRIIETSGNSIAAIIKEVERVARSGRDDVRRAVEPKAAR
jgi:predicted RNA-binding protein YlqC (UPF0109 family)